jgi:type I restriction enzyme, S subunit
VKKPSAGSLRSACHTELGELPADWKVVELGAFDPFITSGSRGWATYYSDFGSPFVRITNLSRSRIYPSLKDLRYVSVPVDNSEGLRTALKAGDVLISITADIGIIGLVTHEIDLPAYVNQHIALVRLPQADVNSRYIAYFLAGAAAQHRFKAMTDSGAKAGMNLTGVREVLAAVPPTTHEQGAIADALGNADAMIDSLEQLLTKKYQIKQGAMQELLTGRRRLPGFTYEWRNKRLGDLLSIRHGRSQNKVESDSGEYPILATGGQIGWTNVYLYDKPSVLIGRKGTINQPRFMDMPFWSVDTLFYSEVHSPNIAKFLYYRFCLIDWMRHNEASGVPSLSAKLIESLEISCPDAEEQQAIADSLSDIDVEITALESRLIKTRALKQAMAQALLTGRIRLVERTA